MVLHGPLRVPSGVANGWRPEGGVADAEHAELRGQAIQVQADAVEIGIRGTPRQR